MKGKNLSFFGIDKYEVRVEFLNDFWKMLTEQKNSFFRQNPQLTRLKNESFCGKSYF